MRFVRSTSACVLCPKLNKHFIMKKQQLIVIIILLAYSACKAQTNFETFTDKFKLLDLPIDNILLLTGADSDTLNKKWTNDILFREQERRPIYIDKNGFPSAITQYFGRYPEEPMIKAVKYIEETGEWVEQPFYFQDKVFPIGRVMLNDNFISLIFKIMSVESTYYDLWNLSRDGKTLSMVCLFYGLQYNLVNDKDVFTIVNSRIAANGDIIWYEKYDNFDEGMETFRTYRLNENGYFQVVQEKQVFAAYISDPDGHTNVRESPNINSPVLYRIYDNERFSIVWELVNDNWYKISSYTRYDNERNEMVIFNEGYIHRSRVVRSIDR